jgi:hypothetical protein
MKTILFPLRHNSRYGRLAALLFAFAALCGCAMSPLPGNDPSSVITPASAKIVFCNVPGTDCTPATSFSVSKLRALTIVVNWSNLSAGNHAQTLAVMDPTGGLYQSFHKGMLMSPGADGSLSTSATLPVAGTWIVQRSMIGTWSVQASLDGQIVATQTVALTP